MHRLHSEEAANLPDCGADPIASLKNMFIDRVQRPRALDGQCPVRRPVFTKAHGSAKATFEVHPSVPPEERIGVFAHPKLDAWIRFSSDTKPGLGDLKSTIGIGIKLFDVPGPKLLDGEEDALTADFILQNHDVFFVDTAKDMCEFTYAGVVLHDYDSYLNDHEETAKILDEMEKEVLSVVGIEYWSCLPYAFGNKYVKYKLRPLEITVLPPIPPNNPNYLRDELKQRLLKGPVRYELCLQFQKDEQSMPINRATVRWDEKVSVPRPFATITLHQQDIDDPGQMAYAENLSYNPWHTLAVHRPAGSISEARKVVYQAGAAQRRQRNGIPNCEPTVAR
ncbi:hypothetical protein [Chitinophaga sp. HK235]|uniref:hypothetical protein n=1 Tax=Chitinophaga sp. HK235 TaxID=2952571 RepID=UPI001BA7D05C|nr:hypothetical protein [Chitinophaga sp. HK235]